MTASTTASPTTSDGPAVAHVIVLLSFVAFGSAMSLRVMDAALPRLASDFNIGLREASYVVTVFSIAYGCLQLVFGPAGDRYGKLRVILFACIAGMLVSMACALAPTFAWLIVGRALAGAAMASMIPLSMAWIGDHVAYEHRQPVLARFLAGQVLGLAMGQSIGGIATDYASWRLPFWLLAGWFLAITALFFRITGGKAHGHVPLPAGAKTGLVAQGRLVVASPWARRVLATVFLEGAALYGPFAFLASHLHVKHGLSLAFSGSLLVAFAFGGLSYTIVAGSLLARLGERGLAAAGATSIAIGLLTVGIAPVGPSVVVFALPALFLAGLGFYMLHNTLQINATQMAPQARGTSVALFASCFFLGQSAGVGLGGIAVEHTTTTVVLVVGALAVLAIGLTFAAMLARRGIAES